MFLHNKKDVLLKPTYPRLMKSVKNYRLLFELILILIVNYLFDPLGSIVAIVSVIVGINY